MFIEKYYECIQDLLDRHFNVVCFDWRGQGMSDRMIESSKKQHIEDFTIHTKDLSYIIKDIIKRPFITFGFLSFVLLIPLALTSPKKMLKKLGYKVWKKIHYLIYPAALLSSFHFFMLVRANKIEPAIYIFIILALLLYRFYYKVIVPRLAQ